MTSPPSLSGNQRRQLRALAHPLSPLVQIGKEGLSESVLSAAGAALTDHELIKVRIPQAPKVERRAMAEALVQGTGAQLVSLTGRVVSLYRRHPDKPKIRLSGR